MPDIYSAVMDGYMTMADRSWAVCRESNDADSYTFNVANYDSAIQAVKDTGARVFRIARSFLSFDCRTIYNIPSAATLTIRGYTNDAADMFLVMGTFPTIGIGTIDFDSIYGWVQDEDNSNNVRKYSDEITTWSTGLPGTNTITLNDNALADIVAHDWLQIVIIEADYDLPYNQPSDGTAVSGMRYTETIGTTMDPKLSYTAGEDTSAALMQINF